MFVIKCPWCGDRDVSEFTYGSDATVKRPEGSENQQDWFDYVYQRDNPRGRHLEYWQHASGCRQWVKVERDTLTHEIGSVVGAADEIPAKGEKKV